MFQFVIFFFAALGEFLINVFKFIINSALMELFNFLYTKLFLYVQLINLNFFLFFANSRLENLPIGEQQFFQEKVEKFKLLSMEKKFNSTNL